MSRIDTSDDECFEDENYERGDKTHHASRLIDGKPGLFPASGWTYNNLKELKIFCSTEEVSVESMMHDLQNSLHPKYFTTSHEIKKVIKSYSKITRENVRFSIDLEDTRKFHRMNWNPEVKVREIVKELKKNSESISAVNVDEYGHKWGWIGTVNIFLRVVQELDGILLQPREYQVEEVESFQRVKEKVRKATKKRKPIKDFVSTKPEEKDDEGVYTHLWIYFSQMFFLDSSQVKKKSFIVKEKIVISKPDTHYELPRGIEPKTGGVPSVVFTVEVQASKEFQSGKSLEENLGTQILGQVGIELFAESSYSVFRPNSFGIICMETKLIFVYLKMPQKHALNILENKPLVYTSIYSIQESLICWKQRTAGKSWI